MSCTYDFVADPEVANFQYRVFRVTDCHGYNLAPNDDAEPVATGVVPGPGEMYAAIPIRLTLPCDSRGYIIVFDAIFTAVGVAQ